MYTCLLTRARAYDLPLTAREAMPPCAGMASSLAGKAAGGKVRVAQRGEGARRRRLAGDDREDDAGDQRLGFLIPMRFAGFAGSVIDQRVGQSHAVVGEIEAVRVDAIERIERRRGQAGRIERIEDMDRAEAGAIDRKSTRLNSS